MIDIVALQKSADQYRALAEVVSSTRAKADFMQMACSFDKLISDLTQRMGEHDRCAREQTHPFMTDRFEAAGPIECVTGEENAFGAAPVIRRIYPVASSSTLPMPQSSH